MSKFTFFRTSNTHLQKSSASSGGIAWRGKKSAVMDCICSLEDGFGKYDVVNNYSVRKSEAMFCIRSEFAGSFGRHCEGVNRFLYQNSRSEYFSCFNPLTAHQHLVFVGN